MISFDKVCILIEEQKCNFIRVYDTNENKLFDIFDQSTAAAAAAKLAQMRDMCETYMRVIIEATDENGKKQNFKNPYRWTVFFNEKTKDTPKPQIQQPQQINGIPPGYVSMEVAGIMAQLEALKMQLEHQKQNNDVQLQLWQMQQQDPMRYAPLLGAFIDLDEKKLMAMNALGNATGRSGINGLSPNQNSKVTQEGLGKELTETDKEKITRIEQNMGVLFSYAGIDKILAVTNKLAEKPQLIDQLSMLISTM